MASCFRLFLSWLHFSFYEKTACRYKQAHKQRSPYILKDSILCPAGEVGHLELVFQQVVLEKDRPLFLYCLRESRSLRAAGILKKMGYTHVKSIGGINRYQRQIVEERQ
ncbi:MAG: rhodanese-like domain-containing protein [Firmicutes bacterium]|nr:rhodanese-like domain-containing protein [Bacillota bacterium]